MLIETLTHLKNFRDKIYHFFSHRRDASMELVDALSSMSSVKSIIELSLNPLHRRNYCSITRVLDEFYRPKWSTNRELNSSVKAQKNEDLTKILSSYCPELEKRNYHVFGVDCTANPRLYAPTVSDRSFVHAPTVISGNKPITIGHQYSIASYFPEKKDARNPPWIIPLSCERVESSQNGVNVGMEQIKKCIESQSSFKEKLCVSVGDSAYSNLECLGFVEKNPNQVHISRARNNRNFYYPYKPKNELKKRKKGRPKQYGDIHKLNKESTWRNPDEQFKFETKSKKGNPQIIEIECWNSLIMRGSQQEKGSDCVFRLMRVRVYKKDGTFLFKRPLWLIVSGKKRMKLSLLDVFTVYRQRFDLEHFFRFGKTRLLMNKSQTPDSTHEEVWWQLVMMSYTQLYLARNVAQNMPKPWERSLPVFKEPVIEKSPTQVQNDFFRIIQEIGTPAQPLKPRKKSKGRQKGQIQIRRQRYAIVSKKKKPPEKLLDTG